MTGLPRRRRTLLHVKKVRSRSQACARRFGASSEDSIERNLGDSLFKDLEDGQRSLSVVQGNPGTGKTIVAIYLLKLLEDIIHHDPAEIMDTNSLFSDFFTEGHAELLKGLRVGFVVPQQSLRNSISKVFRRTPGLHQDMALTPFQVGQSEEPFDLLIVDEAHRLNHRPNQPSGSLNAKFTTINEKLFGQDNPEKTQLDWIQAQSKHVILMLDAAQSVRPADLPALITAQLVAKAREQERLYPLLSQMRIKADQDFVGYVRSVLSSNPPMQPERFDGYDLRFFTDLDAMRQEIFARDREHGLARMVAGYAWDWVSKNDKSAYDIVEDGVSLRWNSTQKDWINTPDAVHEVGSIHTVQGYDLNYAGVIIGKDLQYDPAQGRIIFSRENYFDTKGMENNLKRGITYTDEDILEYVRNIYAVLLTRGIRAPTSMSVTPPFVNTCAPTSLLDLHSTRTYSVLFCC